MSRRERQRVNGTRVVLASVLACCESPQPRDPGDSSGADGRYGATAPTRTLPAEATWTSEDWASLARDSGNVRRDLAQAERVARHDYDWMKIAEAWLDHGDIVNARRTALAALDADDDSGWRWRGPVRFLAETLGDLAAARAALSQIEARLLATEGGSRRGASEWVTVAEAWMQLLGDFDGMTRCLARAAAMVEGAGEMAALARVQVELMGDTAAARQLLEGAEATARARGTFRDLWSIAGVWDGPLADPDRARAALRLGSDEATDVSTLTSLAAAWHALFQDDEGVRLALVRAESAAQVAHDWVGVAGEYRDGGDSDRLDAWDPEGVARCLAKAAVLATTDDERSRVAAGYRQWLGDESSAAALGATGWRPEEAPRTLDLPGWEEGPPLALLNDLRAQIGPESLQAIAERDYGSGIERHLRALRELQAPNDTIGWLHHWYPQEVLELTRWERGASVDHMARAFACTLLVLDAVRGGGGAAGPDVGDTLAPLIESAWALGLDDSLEELLVWLVRVLPVEEPPWAMLGLALCRARRDPHDSRLPELIVSLQEAEAKLEPVPDPDVDGWLFRTTYFTQYADLWRALADAALQPSRGVDSKVSWLAAQLLIDR